MKPCRFDGESRTKAASQSSSLTVPAYRNLPTREGYVNGAEGVRLFYRLVGNTRDTIVFLHGGPGVGIDDGGYDLEALAAKGHTLLLLNERGAGRSEVITNLAKLGIDLYVHDLEAVRQHFRLRRMALIGLSWGSAVGARYAMAYPDRVSRIVFLSPMSVTKDLNKQRAAQLTSMLTEHDVARMAQVDGLWDKVSDADLPSLRRDALLASSSGALASAPSRAPSFEEYWPDMEGLQHRDKVTKEAAALASPAGTFFDFAPTHVLTTASLALLREAYTSGRIEMERFRPNILVEVPGAGFVWSPGHRRLSDRRGIMKAGGTSP